MPRRWRKDSISEIRVAALLMARSRLQAAAPGSTAAGLTQGRGRQPPTDTIGNCQSKARLVIGAARYGVRRIEVAPER